MKAYISLKSQRGAVFLLTAFMLPLLLACAGLAFDLSNMYATHSKLQTLADAAAVAGANNYNRPEHPETLNEHPYSDAIAQKFVRLNTGNWQEIEMKVPQILKNESDGLYYYRVHLQQDVPYYILRYFRSVLGDSIRIDAYAYVRFDDGAGDPDSGNTGDSGQSGSSTGGGNSFKYFDNLITIKGNMTGLNSTQNPDIAQRYDLTTAEGVSKAKADNQRMEISSFYDGNILLGGNLTTNSFLFNSGAKPYWQNGIEALSKSLTAYINTPTYDPSLKNADIGGFIETAKTIAAASTTYQGSSNGNQSFNISDINTNGTAYDGYRYTNNNGGDFQINTTLAGDSSKPFYVIVDNAGNPKIQINSGVDTGRPVIYCYLGTSELWVTGSQGATFRGIIYAPNASKVSVNDNGWTFYGSIVANNLDLQAKGTYGYGNYLGTGGSSTPDTPGSGGTSGDGTAKHDVHLVTPPEDLNWGPETTYSPQ